MLVITDARLGVAASLAALAVSVVTYHWGVLLANLWLTYTGRRRLHRTAPPFLAPTLATAGLLFCPTALTWSIWCCCLTDPVTLLSIPANWREHQR